jgi:hypothetical protein
MIPHRFAAYQRSTQRRAYGWRTQTNQGATHSEAAERDHAPTSRNFRFRSSAVDLPPRPMCSGFQPYPRAEERIVHSFLVLSALEFATSRRLRRRATLAATQGQLRQDSPHQQVAQRSGHGRGADHSFQITLRNVGAALKGRPSLGALRPAKPLGMLRMVATAIIFGRLP